MKEQPPHLQGIALSEPFAALSSLASHTRLARSRYPAIADAGAELAHACRRGRLPEALAAARRLLVLERRHGLGASADLLESVIRVAEGQSVARAA